MALTKLETTSIFLGLLLSGGLMLLGYDQSLSSQMQKNMEKETKFLNKNNENIKTKVNPIIMDLFKSPFLDKSDYDKIFIKSEDQSPMNKAIIYGAILQSIKNRLVNGTYGTQMSDRPINQEEWLTLKEIYNTTLTKIGADIKSFQYTPEKFEYVIKDDETFQQVNENIDFPILRIDSLNALIKHYENSPEFYRQGWSGRYLKSIFENAISIKFILEQSSLDNLNEVSSYLRRNHSFYASGEEYNPNEGFYTRSNPLVISKDEWDKNYRDKFGSEISYWFRFLEPRESKQATNIDLSNLEQINNMLNSLKLK